MKYEIGIVDDHQLFASSLCLMLENFKNFTVVLEATSGKQMQQQIALLPRSPDIILLDVNMPEMDGVACANWLSRNYPATKLAALTMNDTDMAVLSMFRAGCCSYLLKNTHPNEFEKALLEIGAHGTYNAESNINLNKLIRNKEILEGITDMERKFLQFACSEYTYEEIARLMNVTERTVESYRSCMFEKLNVKNRTGMAMEAVRRGLVDL